MAKANIKNVILVLGISIFDVIAGFCDRLINNLGIIKGILDIVNTYRSEPIMQSTGEIVVVQSISAISPFLLVVFVLLMIAIIFIISCTARLAAVS